MSPSMTSPSLDRQAGLEGLGVEEGERRLWLPEAASISAWMRWASPGFGLTPLRMRSQSSSAGVGMR